MATPFRIKRSAVPGKAPAVSDLQLGELALNTYDGDLYTLRVRPGIGTEVIKVGGAAVKNVLHVNKNGDDSNTGQTISDAKLTIRGAVGIATVGTVIKVAAGTYIENNPILELARQIFFHEHNSISIERSEKFGGNITYNSFEELESDFGQKKLHPGDLKNTVGEYMVNILAPIRDNISLSNELYELIKNSN